MKNQRATALSLAALSLCVVAACEAPEPAASGVGFGDYESYLTNRSPQSVAREAQLSGQVAQAAPEATGAPNASTNPVTGVTASDLAAAGIGVTATQSAMPAPQSLARINSGLPSPATTVEETTDPGAPLAAPGVAAASASVPAAPPSVGAAVIQRAESTSAPAQPEAPVATAQPAAPAVAQPRAVASVAEGPDIVAYALSTNHAVGTAVYQRGVVSRAQSGRSCGRYHGADQAQRAFLEAGGPYRDRYGLDPDGDGFACSWSPAPFRTAVGG